MTTQGCCPVAGGRVDIRVNGTFALQITGDITLNLLNYTREMGALSNGFPIFTNKPKPYSGKFTANAVCSSDPHILYKICKVDVVVTEIDKGIRHIFTDCVFAGEPEYNPGSGEISGIEFGAYHYDRQEFSV